MLSEREGVTLRGTVREVLAVSKRGRGKERLSLRDAESALRVASRQHYARRLRRLLDRQQVSEIIGEFSKALPNLNVDIMRERDPRGLAQIAAKLGAGFNAMPFDDASRSGLRGFYIRRSEVIKRPLICVNAATHPVVMASSFWHELGHHLTARLFDNSSSQLNLSFSTNYHHHLKDPAETAADMVSVLAAYPHSTAIRLFAPWLDQGLAPNADSLVGTLRPHLHSVSGFDFERRFSAIQNLRYLSAMVHFGNLRWALLSEFDI